MEERRIQVLENTIADFQELKFESEKLWSNKKLEGNIYGFQVQPGSKWNQGLGEAELEQFQQKMGIKFPESLKNYYRSMNGLDKPGINLLAEEGDDKYGTIFYSYPNGLEKMKGNINWILEANEANNKEDDEIPSIIPYYGHRFLIMDEHEQVLSMWGDDIILWAENLIQGLAQDIFKPNFNRMKEIRLKKIRFWEDKVN